MLSLDQHVMGAAVPSFDKPEIDVMVSANVFGFQSGTDVPGAAALVELSTFLKFGHDVHTNL